MSRVQRVTRILGAVAVAAGLASCAPPDGKGAIVGGIAPCQGVVVSGGPQFAAGTVTVLRGRVRWQDEGGGLSQAVFPAAVAGVETIATNELFHFDLEPGAYVVRARYPTGNAMPFISVTVTSGVTTRDDIPNECM